MQYAMFDVASTMTPFMGLIATAGELLILLGLFALVVWLFKGWGTRLLRISGRLLIVLGVFFFLAQAIWMFAGLQPRLSFEDATAIGSHFWVLGFAFLLPGFFMRVVGALRPTH